MRKIFFPVLLALFTFFSANAQCDYDFTTVNTGSNMTVMITPSALNGPLEPGDQLGVFFVNDAGDLVCGGSLEWTQQQIAFPVWGNEAGEDNGFQNGESLIWKALKQNGEVYDVDASYSALNHASRQQAVAREILIGVAGLASTAATGFLARHPVGLQRAVIFFG